MPSRNADPQAISRPHGTLVGPFLGILTLFISAGVIYSLRVVDPDLWGHLAYGELFVRTGTVTPPDPFAYTTQGLTWFTHEYLSQIILYFMFATWGPIGLIALKCALGGIILWLVYCCVRLYTDNVRIWCGVFLLSGTLISRYLLFRPQLFTYIFFTLFVYLLLRHINGRPAHLWLLPPLTMIWANVHGGFIAGIGLVGLVLAVGLTYPVPAGWSILYTRLRQQRDLFLILGACFLSSLLTPSGLRLWSFLSLELSNSYNIRYIIEWYPIWRQPGLSHVLAVLIFLATAFVWLRVRVNDRQTFAAGVPLLLIGIPLTFLAMRSARHIPIFAIWVAPTLAAGLEAWYKGEMHRHPARLRRTLLWFMAISILPGMLITLHTLSVPAPQLRITDQSLGKETPLGVVQFLRANHLRGNIYTPLWWGSYLTWELYPAIRVSMDGRNDTIFSVAQVGENLMFYLDHTIDTEAPLRYATDYVLAPVSSAAAITLLADARWVLLYRDRQTLLFVRNDGAHADLIVQARSGELIIPDTPWPTFLTQRLAEAIP